MIERDTSMRGRVCLITGGSSGIGKATALALAAKGARVGIVVRDEGRGQATLDEIKAQTGNDQIDLFLAELGSQQSIRALAEEIKGRYDRLHVLVNNAGGVFPRSETVDGIERTFALNHLAYFLLTDLLLDLIKSSAPARIINVSSGAHTGGKINFDDLQGQRKYTSFRAYSQSKLANVLFTYELARRLRGTGVTVNALHPGVVATKFGTEVGPARFALGIVRRFLRTPERGAETSIYLASSPEVEGVTGQYFYDCKPVRSSAVSYDSQTAARLWQVSADLTHQPA